MLIIIYSRDENDLALRIADTILKYYEHIANHYICVCIQLCVFLRPYIRCPVSYGLSLTQHLYFFFQSADGPIVVAAIDFGTTYSGWAFSFKHEFESEPTKISSKHWRGGQLISHKGPTCVLIKPDGKTIHSFAFDAETKYADLCSNGEHTDWYYFRRFKMMLYDIVVSNVSPAYVFTSPANK